MAESTPAFALPYLEENALRKKQFCALHSDGYSSGHRLDIAGQSSLPKAVYEQLYALNECVDYSMTLAEFTMMWRTLLLKRAQDVQEKSTKVRVGVKKVGIDSSILVPAPLHDLLASLGEFSSPSLGCTYYTSAPIGTSTGQPNWNWLTVNAEVLQNWCRVMASMKHQYAMREFPEAEDYRGKSIILTQRSPHNGSIGQTSVRSYTNELRPEDGFVHLVNDSLYATPPTQLHNCHFTVISRVYEASIRADYVGSYVLDRT
ncbi:hypothetical protein TKK_0004589 [Trichogramma kaykai]